MPGDNWPDTKPEDREGIPDSLELTEGSVEALACEIISRSYHTEIPISKKEVESWQGYNEGSVYYNIPQNKNTYLRLKEILEDEAIKFIGKSLADRKNSDEGKLLEDQGKLPHGTASKMYISEEELEHTIEFVIERVIEQRQEK